LSGIEGLKLIASIMLGYLAAMGISKEDEKRAKN